MNFVNFARFHKIKYTQSFPLNGICKKKYALSMEKITFPETKYTKNMRNKY